ncbi:THAP domain-containing protein 2-like [Rhopalosiphum maidis]|uniref:THAP domain-containing protein 2-like n=1 Tax=Rhopalosiphum maidis TaxID=43146 RepID=UPI000F0090AA|nr:THAP domain-containing protein 2-like [Rhopalosiphum maidis]XP_026808415.1 THAP domain-containing protein 2-like [Rhopalosiphum maidis]XP_026809376.1 THAP domain-containing protein 2-like [Rhopalosiphum maidis]XP_026810636.1 THAP domain-containing protein 2-like [Rhopalosiphum maidis]XP_026810701.1 THAP domain-containing protein 2-like [Rhopalosiphum maidis]XP_026814680.1 THAP domain-containing protein 2-like [Rhopalosiphum maidis]XP_026815393.1 THAP domain-containing protein 2-like [Rhopa
MPYKCCADGCSSKDGVVGSTTKLFRFPIDELRRQKWVHSIQRDNFIPTKFSRLCSLHFNKSEFVEAPEKLILKNTAIPSNFDCSKKAIKCLSSNKFDHNYSSSVSSSSNIINIITTSPNLPIDSGVENAGCNYEVVDLTFIGPNSSQSPHTPTYTPTLKRKFKKKLFDTPKKANLKKRIKLLQQTVRRQNTKINSLEVFT